MKKKLLISRMKSKSFNMSTISGISERTISHLYTGNVSTTSSGLSCQRWDSQYPHRHFYTDDAFPDKTIIEASNFCRDPAQSGVLWCLTMNPAVDWGVCRFNGKYCIQHDIRLIIKAFIRKLAASSDNFRQICN
jgi:hypothetical protein